MTCCGRRRADRVDEVDARSAAQRAVRQRRLDGWRLTRGVLSAASRATTAFGVDRSATSTGDGVVGPVVGADDVHRRQQLDRVEFRRPPPARSWSPPRSSAHSTVAGGSVVAAVESTAAVSSGSSAVVRRRWLAASSSLPQPARSSRSAGMTSVAVRIDRGLMVGSFRCGSKGSMNTGDHGQITVLSAAVIGAEMSAR